MHPIVAAILLSMSMTNLRFFSFGMMAFLLVCAKVRPNRSFRSASVNDHMSSSFAARPPDKVRVLMILLAKGP